MNTDNTVHNFDALNYVSTDPVSRDQEQSHLLHQPNLMNSTIDPITGNDIMNPEGHPFIVDGKMVIYFETQETKQAYIDTPIDHPVPLPDNPYEEWVAEG